MPFYKGLARWNSLTLAFILCFEGAIVPVPLEAKNRKGEKIMKDAQDAEARGQYEKALELYTEAAEYFYGRCLFTDPMWASPPGYVTEATQRAGLTSQVGRAATQSARTQSRATEMKDIVD